MSIASRFSAKAWQGATAGGILALTVALVTMPASIMMNANVHHHPVLRIIMGFFGAALNVLTIIYAMIFMRGRNYYGLFPLVEINIQVSSRTVSDGLFIRPCFIESQPDSLFATKGTSVFEQE